MTFEEALARLPATSYTVREERYGSQKILEVWFLYAEADHPHLDEECPCAWMVRTRYSEDDHPVVESRHEKHMVAEVIPRSIQNRDWMSTPATYEDLPTEAPAQRVHNVLKAIPQR